MADNQEVYVETGVTTVYKDKDGTPTKWLAVWVTIGTGKPVMHLVRPIPDIWVDEQLIQFAGVDYT